jgi:hypothetical protein
VPTRLRECGVDAGGLQAVAEHMLMESPQLGSVESIIAACGRMG